MRVSCSPSTPATSTRNNAAKRPLVPRPTCSRRSPTFDYANALRAGLGNPCLALAAKHLAHICTRAIARKTLEGLRHWIEAHNSIGAPLRKPHLVVRIHPDSICVRLLTGELPLFPGFC